MKNFPTENLTELTSQELTEVQGGGLLSDLLTNAVSLVQGVPAIVGTVGVIVKNAITWLV
ncbi:hypothetical protein F0L74_11945 [Chitinophaga agrisoli]|uniref:Uncharacterized protein n=1 Tax=Chitinophaga agrisoli TaxID=2607653 RepID=A0A5B2VX88_9BACT|nr:hypothetical protein [Chitinophaga agrisoli]KAA2243220.1 hypothetical protein F0L74_11945 [Chitinophaga agrisoli]